ncbi:transglutaminase-like domain-containing protein [Profundibacterium mesophilum]|uniref:Transglutaminase-like superfamily domain containing protein n=1 Tax=Profundibacterium mesophilum KAUST100406-0324 TaxID=1037889 RepID=A0A921NUC1_9RHOB|nr:transglutaminase family protein [Profundibacterium mesophilum]KAF0675670.1 Transglutaminase-like superfamily domain containing protein [Profundibacterium mesophilum KAUST100406-0324]
MLLDITARLDYTLNAPSDILLQLEAAPLPDQRLIDPQIWTSPLDHFRRIPAEENIGDRVWVRGEGRFTCDYKSRVEVTREALDLAKLEQNPVHELPGDTIKYLMPSRFCPSDEFQSFVAAEFGTVSGGKRIVAIRDWIAEHFSYVPGSSNAQTSASDSFIQRQGICRDYAHVMITLARAGAIPARFASVYAPDVDPPDFHAVAEIYLGGAWHLVDATLMAKADEMAMIGVGRDAADVAFMTTFGMANFQDQSVEVRRVDDA